MIQNKTSEFSSSAAMMQDQVLPGQHWKVPIRYMSWMTSTTYLNRLSLTNPQTCSGLEFARYRVHQVRLVVNCMVIPFFTTTDNVVKTNAIKRYSFFKRIIYYL